jgi:hypothetical protein
MPAGVLLLIAGAVVGRAALTDDDRGCPGEPAMAGEPRTCRSL